MFGRLILLFVAVPVVETVILIEVLRALGNRVTLALVIVIGVAGAWLAERQGKRVLGGMRRELGEGRVPADRLGDGFMIYTAGLLLVTPGFVTDLIGLLLLFPGPRIWVKRLANRRLGGLTPVSDVTFAVRPKPPI